jgi:hypothetical protein
MVVAWLGLGVVLLVAAALKAADRTGTMVAITGYGVPGRLAAPAWAAVVAGEAALGAGLLAGSELAAYAAAALLGAFMVVQLSALAQGGAGAPCGCFGARGRLSRASAARTALLACACAALPALGGAPGVPPIVAAAIAAGAVALAAGRRGSAPAGALELPGEGPALGAASALDRHVPAGDVRLALFTSAGCRLCARVAPALDALAARGVGVARLDETRDAGAWAAAGVPGAPYAVALDAGGVVLAKGTVNDAAQLESVLATAQRRRAAAALVERPGTKPPGAFVPAGATRASDDFVARRTFLRRAGGVAAGAAGLGVAGSLVKPGDAEAYHFCGHIYTTDGCPHPTGLPRIDRRGLPLRAYDGRQVDDLGRLIDVQGLPVDEDGQRLVDLEGRPLPAAPRTAVCGAVARDHAITTRIDGAWYRCCGGQVRKLMDCCSPSEERINGDKSLKGYCYENRKVFCVMYFQTKVPC